jgi:1-acyl-sn-glycerol-3-phosphate acyltransferase
MKGLKRRLSHVVQRATDRFTAAVVYTFGRWTVIGREYVPPEGPLIIIGNHIHLLDPPLVGASIGRRVRPMAKREIFETPLIGWFFWAYGAFAVRRFSGDMGALRVARNYLRGGDAVLMFPEGTRAKGHGMQPALPGAAMVAILSNAPIVPVAITGSNIKVKKVFFQWLWHDRPKITVTFGRPFHLDDLGTDGRAAEVATDRMMRAVAAMLPEEMRGVYGDSTTGQVIVARQRDRANGAGGAGRTDEEAPSEAHTPSPEQSPTE